VKKFLLLILFSLFSLNAYAHSGRTNSSGCHNSSIYGYHCNHGGSSTTTCSSSQVRSCTGSCTTASWVGDGTCDSWLDCASTNYDGGDCSTTTSDADNDGIADSDDNCPNTSNVNQTDTDNDGIGDACDNLTDSDGDGIADSSDNCPSISNSSQTDTDNDGIGDACDNLTDSDGDGIADSSDNCLHTSNVNQTDTDNDGIGDACDNQVSKLEPFIETTWNFTYTVNNVVVNDIISCGSWMEEYVAGEVMLICSNKDDTLTLVAIDDVTEFYIISVTEDLTLVVNLDDSSNFGGIAYTDDTNTTFVDVLGIRVNPPPDSDGDSVADDVDNCPSISNSNQADTDNDGIGDACDSDTNTQGVLSPIYRFWFPQNKTHFFTINENEKDNIIDTFPPEKYQYGGIAYYAYKAGDAPAGTSPVYRFWFPQNKTHFYTMNENEKNNIISTYPTEKYQYGGIAWYAYKTSDAPEGTIPIYRFWFTQNKTHFYTANENEKDNIINTFPSEKYQYGGVAWYAYE